MIIGPDPQDSALFVSNFDIELNMPFTCGPDPDNPVPVPEHPRIAYLKPLIRQSNIEITPITMTRMGQSISPSYVCSTTTIFWVIS